MTTPTTTASLSDMVPFAVYRGIVSSTEQLIVDEARPFVLALYENDDPQAGQNLLGGFIELSEAFNLEEVIAAIAELSDKHGLSLELGTPRQALSYWQSGGPHPKWVVVLGGKVTEKSYLTWRGYEGNPEFNLVGSRGDHGAAYQIFVVVKPKS